MDDTQRDPKLMAFALLVRANARLTTTIGGQMEGKDVLPLDVYDVLVTLEYSPDQRLRLSDLADRIVLTRSGLTRRVDRLERMGYIRREGCPMDKRGSYAVLTEEGKRAREASWPVYREAIRAYFCDRMTEGEARQLSALMKRVLDSLDKCER